MGGDRVSFTITPNVGPTLIGIRDSDPDEMTRDRIEVALNLAGDSRGEILWLLAAELDHYARRLKAVQDIVAQLRIEDVRTLGPVVFGATYTKVEPATTRKIVDLDALLQWVAQAEIDLALPEGSLIPELWRLDDGNLRITTLREVAERVYRVREPGDPDPDVVRYIRSVEDTFLETTRDETTEKLKEIPIDKAPKYVQGLGHGMRVGSFKNGGPV